MLQRTPEWFAARLGKVTASRINDVLAYIGKNKTEEGVTRRNYRRELALERWSGKSQERDYVSGAMLAGIELEAEARDEYAYQKGVEVTETGFQAHPMISMAGASPDGLVGDDGLLELKCPESNAMWEALCQRPLERRYKLQAMFQLACHGRRRWVDVCFYRDGCGIEVIRLIHDSIEIDLIEREVIRFLAEVEADYQELLRIKGPRPIT